MRGGGSEEDEEMAVKRRTRTLTRLYGSPQEQTEKTNDTIQGFERRKIVAQDLRIFLAWRKEIV